jgi:putative transposase
MTRFIEERRGRFCVELMCRTLGASPSTYYAARTRPPSARAITDAWLTEEVERVFEANYGVYGARKLWRQLHREGIAIGRDRVARLMREAGLQGVRRSKKTFTTRRDERAARPPDLVERDFTASVPNRLWVADITYVRTWAVQDVFSRMIVGWSLTTHLRATLATEALEMAAWRRGVSLEGLIHHSDAGSQGGIRWSSQHLDEEVARWPTGSGRSRCARIGGRSHHRDDRRWRGVRIGSGSGMRSLVV